jgi:hypothetical protein
VADKKTAQPDSSLSLHEVLEAEFVALHGELPSDYPSSSEPETRLNALRAAVHALKEKRAALCISGGGIRSATFGLGILQGLARCGLLEKFHYLSTVSGGSYIGAWLSTWIKREPAGTVSVMWQLARPSFVPPFEPQAVRNLRNRSTYLTEKSGPIFGGAWTWFSAYLWQLMAYWVDAWTVGRRPTFFAPRLVRRFVMAPFEPRELRRNRLCCMCRSGHPLSDQRRARFGQRGVVTGRVHDLLSHTTLRFCICLHDVEGLDAARSHSKHGQRRGCVGRRGHSLLGLGDNIDEATLPWEATLLEIRL